ncbi:MAG TPA: glycosyltransferase family 2 protein [Candidatus Baltobacteraceae bacterium]|nr:glycosyltransferase family 2 protein [Candidatus Baltobacteraceae bacterium]
MNETNHQRFEAAVRRARSARERVEELRADLERLKASRFYRLHTALARPANGAIALERFHPPALERLRELWLRRTAERPLSFEPIASIIIPASNRVEFTVRCLASIASSWFETLELEIIVVDDGSRGEITLLADALPGLIVARNEHEEGPIGACNRGASIARGKYLCFLKDDTSVHDGWLDELVTTAESDGSIAIVGSKLIHPNGRLQEAGSIIYRDGSGASYGRGDDPNDPRYNYVRDVDYCSGASLLVRADVFRSLGGFDTRYAPAYYEDADLCFGARAAGFRVVYQPRSQVVHDEDVAGGAAVIRDVKRYQAANQAKFAERWRESLVSHHQSGRSAEAARRIRRGQVVLVVDSYVPVQGREVGAERLFTLLKIMRDQGFHVIFLVDNFTAIVPYASKLEALGIEVLRHVEGGPLKEAAIDEILPILDYAWITRAELFEAYYPILGRNQAMKFIYDATDSHFARECDEVASGLAAARRADVVITATLPERDALCGLGIANVHLVPTAHEALDVERVAESVRNVFR